MKLDPLSQDLQDRIKAICHEAVSTAIVENLHTGGDEDDITSGLITNLREMFNQLMQHYEDEEIRYKMNLKTFKFRKKFERQIGADILFVQHRYWGTRQRRKYLLIQAKKWADYEPNQDLNDVVKRDKKLPRQIRKMKKSTLQHNFVLVYTGEGFFIKSGIDLIENASINWINFCDFYLYYTLCGYGQKMNQFQDPIYQDAIKLTDPQWALVQVLRSDKKSLKKM